MNANQILQPMWDAILILWRATGGGQIDSEDVLDTLKANGIDPAPGAMDAALRVLQRDGFILGAKSMNPQAIIEHGSMIITVVDPNRRP